MRIEPSSLAIGVGFGLLFGLTVASGLPALPVGDTGDLGEGPDPTDPPRSLGVGTGCIPTADADTGWAHEVATGTSRTFTANLTVAHDAAEELNVSFETLRPGVYVFSVDVVDGGTSGSPDCTTGSTVEFAASLPTDYERVELRVEGETVETVGNDGDTTADLSTFAWNESVQTT